MGNGKIGNAEVRRNKTVACYEFRVTGRRVRGYERMRTKQRDDEAMGEQPLNTDNCYLKADC